MKLVAVDVGNYGGLATWDSCYDCYGVYDTQPDAVNIDAMICRVKPDYVVLEQVNSGWFSKVANFALGKNYGQWQGVLTGRGIPWTTVPPHQWQKKYQDPKPDDIKIAVWTAVSKRFPHLFPGDKFKDSMSHKSDAFAILLWAVDRWKEGTICI